MGEVAALKALVEKLLAERETRAAELTKLDYAIETIQAVLGEPTQPKEAKEGAEATLATITHTRNILQKSQKAHGAISVRPDQFFGMSHTGAAEAYLKMVGHAAHIEEILNALRSGGIAVGGADPKKTLYTELVRGTKRFVLVPPQTFGLREFYPNLPKKIRKEATKKARLMKKKKKKSGKVKPGVAKAKKTLGMKPENDASRSGE